MRELLQQALDALLSTASIVDGYYIPRGKQYTPECDAAIPALREALAAPMPEPVAWQWLSTGHIRKKIPKNATDPTHWNPLYAAPPAAPAPSNQLSGNSGTLNLIVPAPVVREPQIDYTVLHGFADKHRISYNELCAAVRDSLSGIGGGGK